MLAWHPAPQIHHFATPLTPRSANVNGHTLPPPLQQHEKTFHFTSPWAMSDQENYPASPQPQTPQTSHDLSGQSAAVAPVINFSFAPPTYPLTPANETPARSTLRDPRPQRRRGPVKTAPVARAGELRERRRKEFLEGVRERREEGRYEDMMRLEFLRERKDWEEELARSSGWRGGNEVPDLEFEDEFEEIEAGMDVEGELPGWPSSGRPMRLDSTQQDEVEDVAQKEQEELEALLEYMPSDDQAMQEDDEHLYSDDGEYGELFEELVAREAQVGQDVDEEMDLT